MENEIIFGHFQYIRCMALIHDGGERRTPAVYRHDMTAPDGKGNVIIYGAGLPTDEKSARAFDESRYIEADAEVVDTVIFFDGTGPHTREFPFLEDGGTVYRYLTKEDAERVRSYFTPDYTLRF